jgi:hypothetical protein
MGMDSDDRPGNISRNANLVSRIRAPTSSSAGVKNVGRQVSTTVRSACRLPAAMNGMVPATKKSPASAAFTKPQPSTSDRSAH